jgi:UDP-3-O-[3-hydroxymyristoyl] glucosamine N-acyltransferase
MKFPSPLSVKWIAEFINAELVGNTNGNATGINEIHNVEEGDLVFVDHPKYYDKCINSAATFIIINKHAIVPEGKALLIVDEPFEAYCKIATHFRPFETSSKAIRQQLAKAHLFFRAALLATMLRLAKTVLFIRM